MVPHGRGFVYSGEGADLQEWHPDYGFCPQQLVPGMSRTRDLFRLGDVLIAFGPPMPGGNVMTVLEVAP